MAKNWELSDLNDRYKRQLQGDNPNPEYPEPLASKAKRKNAQPERDLRRDTMKCAQYLGWRVIHIPKVQVVAGQFFTAYEGDGPGWPDLFMLRAERKLVAETKIGNNTTTPEQDAWLRAFLDAGFHVYVWTLDDWQSGEIERILR